MTLNVPPASPSAVLLISCPDRRGLAAAVTDFIFRNNGNILHLDQHVDGQQNVFFMRVEWDLDGFAIARGDILTTFMQQVGDAFAMHCELYCSDIVPRMALFVTKESHCLYDILSRVQSGEWRVEVPLIISNHPDLGEIAHKFGINYRVFPVNKENKLEQEKKQIAVVREQEIDFIVLARYMQVLSDSFVSQFPHRIINIHHSFLPAFPGGQPYHKAHNRGVKLIGATSHYVTAELDAGPIIEQEVIRINHKDSVEDLIRKGKDVEKIALSRAIRYHLQHQILVYGNKTVIFA
ncbi:MAG: formyltetrahydrofolate deformylase [Anaerolineae bacterium]